MAKQPMAEVFGYPIDNITAEAKRHRDFKLCPFNNYIPNCTKDKAKSPLGVCSVNHKGGPVITCPVRFREQWLIAEDAAKFFFDLKDQWTSISEVKLKDIAGKSAGNIDFVLVAYDEKGKITDFGALEVQAVYISGNIREPFEQYTSEPESNTELDWEGMSKYPKPDFLSSSRKRLAPQLLFKGGILNHWKKKSAVALDKAFFDTLPHLDEVAKSKAEVAWFVYDLVLDKATNKYVLTRVKTVYTKFSEALSQITVAKPGKIEDFTKALQKKLDRTHSSKTPPSTMRLDEML